MLSKKIRPVTWGLAIYFFAMATDSMRVGNLGSLLKILMFIPIVLSVIKKRNYSITRSLENSLLLLFMLISSFSICYSIQMDISVSTVTTLITNMLCVIYLGSIESYNEEEKEFLLKALLMGSWLTILLMFTMSDIYEGRLSLRLGSITQDQNYINGYLIFAFTYHMNQSIRKRSIVNGLLSLITVIIVFFTGSRGGLLAFFVASIMVVFCYIKESANFLRNLVILTLVTGVCIALYTVLMNNLPEEVALRYSIAYLRQNGTTGREVIWKNLLQHFFNDNLLRQIFGHGYGTTIIVNTYNGLVAHNLFLDNLITIGIIGAIIQVLLQIRFIVLAIKSGNVTILSTYVGFIVMCISLSLTSYKPIWNIMIMILIITKTERLKLRVEENYDIKRNLQTSSD